MHAALNDLLDDFTREQYRALIDWLWVNEYRPTRSNIKSFRLSIGLTVHIIKGD